ncbi:hypothetical protein [Pseudactinotalea suaedae]|jgi:hypothetical protein|uniref:hypothetical protein n=1 Tax=Pseudactinotalea suaedae TaxID=1524924 RepID=UPI0012E26C59|nr:hypothetical protein [Pseudactinotalea suaedae]
MTYAMIQVTDVPQVKGNPETVETAGSDLTGSAQGATDAASAVTGAWSGLSEANYHTPESPAVFQSVPRITAPMDTISSNMTALGTALSTAGTTLGRLKTRAATLEADVRDFVTRAEAMDDFAKAGGSIDDETWSTWRDAPGLAAENDRLWSRARSLQTDLDTAGTDLYDALLDIYAPNPVLPEATFEAGVPSGNRASAEGPGASATSWAGTTYTNGNWYAGAGAEADAHLFDLSAHGSVDTRAGTFGGDAALYGGARANASANTSIGVDGIHGKAQAGGFAGVEGSANGSWNAGPLSANVGARGMAGAEAEASAGVDVGLDGVSANAGVTAFAGAKAEANASVGVSGAKANVGADVRAGIGVDAKAEIAVTSEEVKVSLDLGVAIGVGAGVKLDFEIKPKKIVDDVKSFFGF